LLQQQTQAASQRCECNNKEVLITKEESTFGQDFKMLHWRRNSVPPPKRANGGHGPIPNSTRPLNIPETIAELLDTPSSTFSLLQGQPTMLMDKTLSYTNIVMEPCNCCKDQAVAFCCRNQKPMACVLPVGPRSTALEVIKMRINFEDETILQWAVGGVWSKSWGGGGGCMQGQTEFMVATTSGFYHQDSCVGWGDVNPDQAFTDLVVKERPTWCEKHTKFCWEGNQQVKFEVGDDPTSELHFNGRPCYSFDTGNPNLNKSFRMAIEEHLFPKELDFLVRETDSNGETVSKWDAEVLTGTRGGGRDAGGPSGMSLCFGPKMSKTHVVVTTSGFCSKVLNFRWEESVNQEGNVVGFVTDCPNRELTFLRKTWDNKGNWSSACFSVRKPEAFLKAVAEHAPVIDYRTVGGGR